ncbi:hypothetical protein HanRHA438_Chr14g0682271 [Helianthus annuus]|nr:hypothetical protein HanRHA438_Chr14g0682271 [Helianthus annuus]
MSASAWAGIIEVHKPDFLKKKKTDWIFDLDKVTRWSKPNCENPDWILFGSKVHKTRSYVHTRIGLSKTIYLIRNRFFL